MRLAIAVLADAASVRENMLSVLSAGVNQIVRPDFPAQMGLSLAMMLEVLPDDEIDAADVEVVVDHVPPLEDEKPVARVRARLELKGPRDGVWYVPMPLDFHSRKIPTPGNYEVRVNVTGADPVVMGFVAHSSEDQGDGD